ncbi:MAG: hypothetical protein R3E01_18420 [Pirellulaceae bacterium]
MIPFLSDFRVDWQAFSLQLVVAFVYWNVVSGQHGTAAVDQANW